MNDKYVYPDTDVLQNKFDVKDQDKLERLERMLSGRRLLELFKDPLEGQFDLNHLQNIHRYIFQDIYEWAGELRTVNITKGNHFALHNVMVPYFEEHVTVPLHEEKLLEGVSGKSDLAQRMAIYFDHVNAAHPFREGNGRAQREFFRTLALRHGFQLDWSKASQEEMIESSKQALAKMDPTGLEEILYRCMYRV